MSATISNPDQAQPRKKRVMVVDDDSDIVSIVKSALTKSGYDVDSFTNPLAALSHFKKDLYDLLLLDYVMPGMNGYDLYMQTRRIDNSPKAIMLSLYDLTNEDVAAKFPGIDPSNIMRKPVSLRTIIDKIKELGLDP